MSALPNSFKFMFTSRNVEQIYSKVIDEQIKYVHLKASSANNIKDIEEYIKVSSKFTQPESAKLVSTVGGNFLLVKLFSTALLVI